MRLFELQGYEETTLRAIALDAGVSVGLVYLYFPSKRALVEAFYDELSQTYVEACTPIPEGDYQQRILFALQASFKILEPHRPVLRALTPVLVGDPSHSAVGFQDLRQRILNVFCTCVVGATNAPQKRDALVLGRLFYLMDLALLLFWLLDESPSQNATQKAVALVEEILPLVHWGRRLGPLRSILRKLDALACDGLRLPREGEGP